MPSRAGGKPHQLLLTSLAKMCNNVMSGAITQLARSFPSVEYILMVGIAGGAEDENLLEPVETLLTDEIRRMRALCRLVAGDPDGAWMILEPSMTDRTTALLNQRSMRQQLLVDDDAVVLDLDVAALA